MDNYIPGEAYQKFETWYKDNAELVNNLQDWLFYLYNQVQRDEKQDETMIEVADMTVYLELFYFSSQDGNKYSFSVSLKELTDTLETDEKVVLHALDSLERHHAISYKNEDGKLEISITPIEVVQPHDHDHDHHDHHHHDHEHHD